MFGVMKLLAFHKHVLQDLCCLLWGNEHEMFTILMQSPVGPVQLTALLERLFEVNLFAIFWGCSVAVRQFLKKRLGGVIVNISSIQATAAFPG